MLKLLRCKAGSPDNNIWELEYPYHLVVQGGISRHSNQVLHANSAQRIITIWYI
jgi:hypothetical protein